MDPGGLWECAGQSPRWARIFSMTSGRSMKASKDWLSQRSDWLSFTVRLSEGQLRYSAKGVDRYIAGRLDGRRR